MAFISNIGLSLPGQSVRPQRRAHRRNDRLTMCSRRDGADALYSPGAVARAWEAARTAASATDISRRYVNVLFVSNNCHRALIAERIFEMLAGQRSRARRLLVHSAGIDAIPGAKVSRSLLVLAAQRGVSLADSQPCARFDVDDFEFYDFILVMDRTVQERILRLATGAARNNGGNLSDWERKIRLVADFNGERSAGRESVGMPVDIPRFPNHGDLGDVDVSVDYIHDACERVIDALIAAGL